MKYKYEGSNGGYPLCDDSFDQWYDFLCSHHDCSICGDKNVSEEILYKTNFGWMHIDCYNDIVSDPDTLESEIPEIL